VRDKAGKDVEYTETGGEFYPRFGGFGDLKDRWSNLPERDRHLCGKGTL